VQLGRVREAIKRSYDDRGWEAGTRGEVPPFGAFYELLKADTKPDKGLMTRLSELADYGLFEASAETPQSVGQYNRLAGPGPQIAKQGVAARLFDFRAAPSAPVDVPAWHTGAHYTRHHL